MLGHAIRDRDLVEGDAVGGEPLAEHGPIRAVLVRVRQRELAVARGRARRDPGAGLQHDEGARERLLDREAFDRRRAVRVPIERAERQQIDDLLAAADADDHGTAGCQIAWLQPRLAGNCIEPARGIGRVDATNRHRRGCRSDSIGDARDLVVDRLEPAERRLDDGQGRRSRQVADRAYRLGIEGISACGADVPDHPMAHCKHAGDRRDDRDRERRDQPWANLATPPTDMRQRDRKRQPRDRQADDKRAAGRGQLAPREAADGGAQRHRAEHGRDRGVIRAKIGP